jgi:hypothetical protein
MCVCVRVYARLHHYIQKYRNSKELGQEIFKTLVRKILCLNKDIFTDVVQNILFTARSSSKHRRNVLSSGM